MRVLFLGDIVGRIARNEIIKQLPGLRDELALDFVVVNCENAAACHTSGTSQLPLSTEVVKTNAP